MATNDFLTFPASDLLTSEEVAAYPHTFASFGRDTKKILNAAAYHSAHDMGFATVLFNMAARLSAGMVPAAYQAKLANDVIEQKAHMAVNTKILPEIVAAWNATFAEAQKVIDAPTFFA